jgi:hypothetical protein
MHERKGNSRKTPKCIRSVRNQRAMCGIVEAPSFLDLAKWPVEEIARLIGGKVIPTLVDTGEAVHNTVVGIVHTGSALLELARKE